MDFYEKEYKDMVQRARELHESGNALTKLQMEIVCPGLKESEDERIRKEILKHFIEKRTMPPTKAVLDEWIAYLERQKEKKPSSYSNLEITNVVRKALQECEGFNNCRPDVYAARVGATVESLLQEQKPAEWSEEDRRFLTAVIGDVEYSRSKHKNFDQMYYEKELNWLKDLPNYFALSHWKPSKEQIDALERAIVKMHSVNDIDILAELRDNLKKLLL